jgi:hypothetical protein
MEDFEVYELLEMSPRRRLIFKIRLERGVDTFAGLARVAAALQTVDALARRDLEGDLRLRSGSLDARARIITFYLGSPPEATLVVNPAWLALFISVLALLTGAVANYDKIKTNIPVVQDDLRRALNTLRGISDRQRRNLERAVRLLAGRIINLPEQRFQELADRLGRIRQEIVGPELQLPEMEIVDLDENHDEDRES